MWKLGIYPKPALPPIRCFAINTPRFVLGRCSVQNSKPLAELVEATVSAYWSEKPFDNRLKNHTFTYTNFDKHDTLIKQLISRNHALLMIATKNCWLRRAQPTVLKKEAGSSPASMRNRA